MADREVKLPQEQIDALIAAIEKVERRRRIMLWGYLLSALVLILGQIAAFVVVANVPRGTFIAWVFFVPFALVGVIFLVFGRVARKKAAEDRSKPRPHP